MSLSALLGRMFGSDKALEKTIDAAAAGIDKLAYTKEEKADAQAEARKLVVDWIASSQGHNVTRRLLAVLIAGTWLIQYWVSMLLGVIAVWADDAHKFYETAKVVGDYADDMTGAMMLILTFYFAAPHLDTVIGKAFDRFGRSRPPASPPMKTTSATGTTE